jgi:hypothetical protein
LLIFSLRVLVIHIHHLHIHVLHDILTLIYVCFILILHDHLFMPMLCLHAGLLVHLSLGIG